jgi:glutathione S-transferase
MGWAYSCTETSRVCKKTGEKIMTPILFYLPGSCAFGSIVTLEWIGQPFYLCRLDGLGLKSATYLHLDSLSQVPTFESKTGSLTESAAILQHIAFLDLDKKLTYRQGTKDYDHLNQMMSYLTTSLHTSIGPIVHPDRAADEESAQKAVVQKAKNYTVPARLRHIEQMINHHGWLAGDHPTIADAYFYGVARAAKEFINFEKDFPIVFDFFLRFKSDPGVVFAQAIEDQKPEYSSGGFKGHVELASLG